MDDTCDDSRFELIGKYKQKILDATNIGDSPEEMAVIDNILFRFWQMGCLEKLELFGNSEQLDCSDCVNNGGDWECDHVQCRKGTDTISRQAAFDVLNGIKITKGANWYEFYQKALTAVGELPSAQQWIPCKERLPKPREYEDGIRKYYLIQNEFGDMMVCSWDGKYWEQMYQYKNVRDKVVAWMPLPEPWKGGQK